MKHVYNNTQTNAYFAVQTIADFVSEIDYSKPQKWFTVLIINTLKGNLLIDNSLAAIHFQVQLL